MSKCHIVTAGEAVDNKKFSLSPAEYTTFIIIHFQLLLLIFCRADAECMFSSDFPPHIEVRCVQKYMIKKLIALEPLTGDAYFDEFPVPSCCVCMYKNKDIDYDDT